MFDANMDFGYDYTKNSGGTVDYTDPGLTRSRSDAAKANWNKMPQQGRTKARKALQARGEWKGGDRAQKSIERGSS